MPCVLRQLEIMKKYPNTNRGLGMKKQLPFTVLHTPLMHDSLL